VGADAPVTPPLSAPRRPHFVVDLISFCFVLLPIIAGLWMARHGGGYTIDEWGAWAVVIALALAVSLVALPVRLKPLAYVPAGCLFGLTGLALLSMEWAALPQNALVDGDRYFFAGCVLGLATVTLARAPLRRAAVGVVVAGSAGVAFATGFGLLHGSITAGSFELGRLVGAIGYGGGTAAVMAIGIWPLVAFASDRATSLAWRPLAGAGAAAAIAAVIPTGARAAVGAIAIAGAVFLVVCPTPLRSGVIALPGVVGTALQWHSLNLAYSAGTGVSELHTVGRSILLIALAGGLVALVQGLIDIRVQLTGTLRQVLLLGAAVVLMACGGIVAGTVWSTVNGHPVGWVQSEWHSFKQQGNPYSTTSATRFTSVGGGRYDLWRAALRVFFMHPLKGVGAGNFAYIYLQEGRSAAQPQQAHSEPLEVAATLGYAGVLLLIPVMALPIGVAVRNRLTSRSRSERLLMAGLAAALTEFVCHASVDWTWHIAADSLPALVLAGAVMSTLAAAPRSAADARKPAGAAAEWARWARRLVPAVAAVALVGVSLGLVVPPTLAQGYLLSSYGAPPTVAIADANKAARWDWLSSRPDIAIARADLGSGDLSGALRAARDAVRKEPNFWVAWQMLYLASSRGSSNGDLTRAYMMVRKLNPSLPLDFRYDVPPPTYDHY